MKEIRVKCPAKTTSALGEQDEPLEMSCPALDAGSHGLRVKCPAKINLTLEILNKREDGFHNIQSVMQTIGLFDILTIKIVESPELKINLSGTSSEIPYDERNLVYKAAKLYMETLDPSPLAGEGGWKPDEGFKKILQKRAKEMRNSLTPPEEILWYYLRNRNFANLKFRRQVPIDNYIADFVCFEKRLIIELDGSKHLQAETIDYDKKRDEFLKNQNFRVLRFYNNELSQNLDGVLELIYISIMDDNFVQSLDCRLETPHPQPLSRKGRGEILSQNYLISIHIEKNIPIAAGLAGGSTDAAGTLYGLNKIFNEALSSEEIHSLCAQLGSDLNFCLEGGCQLATSRGEILEKLPFQEFEVSLVKPKNLGISAKEAYTKFSQLEKKPNLDATSRLVSALRDGHADVKNLLHNDLEIALIDDYKELREIKTKFPTSIMSGSGSTFFTIGEDFKNFDESFWVENALKSLPFGVCEDK